MTMELIFMIMASSLSLGGEQSTSAKKGDQSTRPSSESNSRSPVDLFFANIAATAYRAFSMLPFGSSSLISA